LYNVGRNNFYDNEKNSTVYTPAKVSQFIFDIVHEKIDKSGSILDPCVGKGSLLEPFKDAGFNTIGIDIEDQGYPKTILKNFIEISPDEIPHPSLVVANPPFNIDEKTKHIIAKNYGRRPLFPEIWLQKTLELFGNDVPIILFAPYGLRLNQTVSSRRWKNFIDGKYPKINSIISLPKDIYKDVLFHSEILIFNIEGLEGHYFYNG